MALNSTREMNKALGYYYFYYTTLYALAVLIGLSARLILPELAGGDCELALLVLAEKLLPEFLIGVVLAGLFSSTMSTADSLVLSASSVVTRDLFPKCQKTIE
jgi:sodium/proline symporter